MPDQGFDSNDPDQWPDPDQWLADFKASLAGIGGQVDPSIAASVPPPPAVPGLLGSSEDIAAIARQANGQPDPSASITANALRASSGALPYRAVPSPHAGYYPTLDQAALAAASDVPRNPSAEYGAYLPGRYVTDSIDLGDGFGPQSISYVNGYDYGGLYTSGDSTKVTLGPPPPHLGGWLHNHPWDASVADYDSERPSPGNSKDEGAINQLHQTQPMMDTYIQGPDGILRRFWRPNDQGKIVK